MTAVCYARFDYPEKFPLRISPATVTLNDRRKIGKGPPLRLPPAWFEFTRAVNTPEGFRIATAPNSGWVNEGFTSRQTPLTQSLTMGGNVAAVNELDGKFARISTFRPDQAPPDPARKDELIAQGLLHRFTCVSRSRGIHNPGRNVVALFPLITKEDAWALIAGLELFDEMPAPIWPGEPAEQIGYDAALKPFSQIRQSPGGNQIRKVGRAGQRVSVQFEANGWARIGDQRWVELADVMKVPG